MMADVNLFCGRGGAARGGVVGRQARRVASRVIVYHKPVANVLWTLSRLVKIFCTL